MKRLCNPLVMAAIMAWACSVKADTYYSALTSGQSGAWTNSLMWTNSLGANGIPGINDAVILNQLPSGGYDVRFTNAFNVSSLTINSINNGRHNLHLDTNGYIGILNYYNASTPGFVGFYWEGNNRKIIIQQYNIIGPNVPNGRWSGNAGAFLFTNAAQVTYHTTNMTELANRADFSGATNVYLVRSSALGVTTMETLGNQGGNDAPLLVGRADNGVQNWTVGSGNHPLLKATDSTQSKGISKTGTGLVNMPDVDLWILCSANNDIGISSTGNKAAAGTALYQGEIRANSFTFTRGEATTVRTQRFDIVGPLVLDGQAGLQGSGTGNGRAFSLTSSTNGQTRVKFGSLSSVGNNGQAIGGNVTITPEGGEFYLAAQQAGSVVLELYSRSADRTKPTLTANTINLASPGTAINDRDPYNNVTANAGGTLEIRKDFKNQCTRTNEFRLDSSTLRCIGATSQVEAASRDLGAVNPGTNNFAIGTLVVGQDSTGITTKAKMILTDAVDNHLQTADPEALYASNLLLYASSTLYLNGLKLYYFNGTAWVQATAGAYLPGDGTGKIAENPAIDPPTVSTGSATNVTLSSSTMKGVLIDAGSGQTMVTVFWGLTDGGTNKAAWSYTNTFAGYQPTGTALETNVTFGTPNRFYYFRFYATNSSSEAWAPFSSSFMAAPVTIQASIPDAWEEGTVPGAFTISRDSILTNEAITVNFTVGGTAANGTDYAAFSSPVLLPAGQASVIIPVVPLIDAESEADETVVLSLTGAAYPVGDPSNATVTIRNNANQVWYCALTNAQNGNWSASATWTNSVGTHGVPTADDAVILNTLASGAYTLNFTPGWGSKYLTLNSSGSGQHFINLQSDGFVDTLTWNNASPPGFVGLYWEGGSYKTTVRQFRDMGVNVPNGRWVGNVGVYLFTNAAQIVYHTTNDTTLADRFDFSGATSVTLAASTRLSVTNREVIKNEAGNGVPPITIGRADGGQQTWSVAQGSHPMLLSSHGTQSSAIKKTGTGDADLSPVDLWIPFSNPCGISPDGDYGYSSGLYAGKITLNSLRLDATPGASILNFGICGTLLLDGQGGLQAGGTGNRHALNVTVAGTNECNLHIGSGYWNDNWKPGRLEFLPGSGDMFLSCSSPTSRLKIVACGLNRNTSPNSNQVVIVANNIHIASTNVYLTDRSPDDEGQNAWAGGQIELRGCFTNQSTMAVQFRLDHTILRALGTNMVFEAPSRDLGAVDPGTNNFMLGALVLGKSAVSQNVDSVSFSLTDAFNNPLDSETDAVYVETLELFNNARLYLKGINLYYKNSGTWQKANFGAFSYGDGTGRISERQNLGTLIQIY